LCGGRSGDAGFLVLEEELAGGRVEHTYDIDALETNKAAIAERHLSLTLFLI